MVPRTCQRTWRAAQECVPFICCSLCWEGPSLHPLATKMLPPHAPFFPLSQDQLSRRSLHCRQMCWTLLSFIFCSVLE